MDSCTGDPVRPNVRQCLYKPISETEYRVVHLLLERFLDEIQCVLETQSFRVKTRYEALSYQWGDEPNTTPIRIAHLTLHPSTSGILTKVLPGGANRVLVKASRVLPAAAKRYIVALRIFAWFLGTCFFCRLLLPHPPLNRRGGYHH